MKWPVSLGALAIAALVSAATDAAEAKHAQAMSTWETAAGEIATLAKAGEPIAGIYRAARQMGFVQLPRPDIEDVLIIDPVSAHPSTRLVPFDLVVSALSLPLGDDALRVLRQAQGTSPGTVLLIEGGIATLASLVEATKGTAAETLLQQTAGGYFAHAPIVVGPHATLVLQEGETLTLDTAAGAFLMSSGNLVAYGAHIAGSDATNTAVPAFRPFIAIGSSGSVRIEGAQLTGLGASNGALRPALTILQASALRDQSYIRNAVVSGSGSLSIAGYAPVSVENTVFAGSLGPAILIRASDGSVIEHNVIAGSVDAHGLKISDGASNTRVIDNIVVGSGTDGIFIDRAAEGVLLLHNLIAGNGASAIGLTGAMCVAVKNNILVGNSQHGLAIRRSLDVAAFGNVIAGNEAAGVSIKAQPVAGKVALSDNAISGNKFGVSGVAAAQLTLAGNDLRGQSPHIFDGDLVQFTSQMLASLAHGQPSLSISVPALASASSLGEAAFMVDPCQFGELI